MSFLLLYSGSGIGATGIVAPGGIDNSDASKAKIGEGQQFGPSRQANGQAAAAYTLGR